METEGAPSQITTEIVKTIDSINNALNVANSWLKSLKEKARVVKSQIQDDISFHLELLRNREVWLLEQVDLIAQVEEESIVNHQSILSSLLAKLEVYLELLSSPTFGENCEIAVQVNEALSSIQNESLNIDESPEISFVADNFAVSHAIKSFGSIGGNQASARNTQRRSWVSNKASTQDPLLVLENFKSVSNSSSCDWLIPTSSSMDTSEVGRSLIEKVYKELQQSDPKEWLLEEAQPLDLGSMKNALTSFFEEVKEAPLTDWVRSVIVTQPSDKPTIVLAYGASEDDQDAWLVTPTKSPQAPEESSNESSCEIEKLNDSNTVQSEWLLTEKNAPDDPVSTCPGKLEDSAPWLLTCEKTWSDAGTAAHNDSWLQRFRESVGKSTSDWLIVPEAEPEYCEWLTRESIERCKNCPGECARDTFKTFRHAFNPSRSEWLATANDW